MSGKQGRDFDAKFLLYFTPSTEHERNHVKKDLQTCFIS